MDGVLVIDKPKNMTSRDVVNEVCKVLNTKKVGHTGTLDPIATGVLVLCVGRATKLVEVLTSYDKAYVATVKIGVLTDTLDIDGKVLKESNDVLDEKKLKKVIESFKGTYEQEVPAYSAVKIKGKKLYEYAREDEEVLLPKRKVEIKDIKLLKCKKNEYVFYAEVSKGTYIRSLIRDINDKLGIIGSMGDLRRIRQGEFGIEESYSLQEIRKKNFKIISIKDLLKDYYSVRIDSNLLLKKVTCGALIDNVYNENMVVFIHEDEVITIYKTYQKDKTKLKPFKMFL